MQVIHTSNKEYLGHLAPVERKGHTGPGNGRNKTKDAPNRKFDDIKNLNYERINEIKTHIGVTDECSLSANEKKKLNKRLFLISMLLSDENLGRIFTEEELRKSYYLYGLSIGITTHHVSKKKFVDISDLKYAIDMIKTYYGRTFSWNADDHNLTEIR